MADLNVNSIGDASGGNTASINGYTPTMSNMAGRNYIINGDMRIAQRGTSFNYSNGESGYSLDRYVSAAFVSGGSLAISQQIVTLSDNLDAEFFMRATTTGSVAAGSATIYTEQKVENLKRFHNKAITLSFYVKASSDLTFQLRSHKYYGSGGSSEEFSGLSDVAATTSWTRHTVTFAAEDLSSKTFGASNYFGIMFYWSTSQGTNQLNDASIDITNVQLEEGSVATPFEHRQYGQELALCQRYYQQRGGNSNDERFASGFVIVTTQGRFIYPARVVMRATPTLTVSSGGDFGIEGSWGTVTATSLSLDQPSPEIIAINCNVGGGLTPGYGCQLQAKFSSARLMFSAEL